MRVERIADIVQARGVFERIPAAQQETLVPEFLPIQATAEMLSDTDLGVTLVLGFIARAQSPTNTASTARSTGKSSGKPTRAEEESPFDADVRMYVEAGYMVRYILSAGPKPSDDELQKFAEVNGRLNITPYWREFLDTSLRRAGLPAIMAPVYRVSPKPTQPSSGGSVSATELLAHQERDASRSKLGRAGKKR